MLKEAIPVIGTVAVLYGSKSGGNVAFLHAAEAAASASAVQLTPVDVSRAGDWEQQIATFTGQPNGGLLVVAHPFTTTHRKTIIAAAVRLKLPAIYTYRFFAGEGGLISYGPDQIGQWRGAASYVDRILRGEKPGELPIQAPTKYELVLDLKTAKALGLDFPESLPARADDVIE